MTEALDDLFDQLYGTPLADFTHERNEVAKALKAEGRKEDAAAVKALKKPSTSAWVVNQLHFRHRAELDGLLEANEAIRQAHTGDPAELRDGMEARRAALDGLLELAGRLLEESGVRSTREQLRRVSATLEAATSGLDQARPGRLTTDLEPAGFGALSGFAIAAAPTSKPAIARPRPKQPPASRSPKRAAPTADPQTALQAAEAALKDAEARLARAEREVTRAETAALAAVRHVDKLSGRIEELEERTRKVRQERSEAEEDANVKSKTLDEAKQALTRAEERLRRAREALNSAVDTE